MRTVSYSTEALVTAFCAGFIASLALTQGWIGLLV